LLASDELARRREQLLAKLDWQNPVFEISAATGAGTERLAQLIMQELEKQRELGAPENGYED
jgi:putative protein kinase ArgK-like GTPase of G3E family